MFTPRNSGEIGDGASTGQIHGRSKERNYYRMRKLTNAVRVPVLKQPKPVKDQVFVPIHPEAVQTPAVIRKPIFKPNIPAVECAICYGPVKEATVPKCGHLYCHQCIKKWSKIRSWCPMCQGTVDPLIRVYSIDEQIDKYYLDDLSQEERREFDEAAVRRKTEQRINALREKRIWNRMWRKYYNMKYYFQSKGFIHGIQRQGTRGWRSMKRIKLFSKQMFIGILIGFILCSIVFSCFGSYTFNPWHFMKYMWEAVKNYSGSWVPGENTGGLPPPEMPPVECDLNDMSCPGKKVEIAMPCGTGKCTSRFPASSQGRNLFALINFKEWFESKFLR